MDRGSKNEREHHGAKDAADHSDGQRLQHGGTSPDAESQRKHASDGGQRRHGDGAQAAAAGLDHGFFRGEAEVAEAMLGVQEENAVLGHDADDHDHAHAGSDIEGSLGDQQRQKSAEAGEQSGGQNCGGRGESTKFEKQDSEEEQQGKKQNHQQIAGGFLFFSIEAAIFDTNGRGQMQSLYRFLYGGDAGAKVHAFEAPGDLNKALQILAADFRLAGIHAA